MKLVKNVYQILYKLYGYVDIIQWIHLMTVILA